MKFCIWFFFFVPLEMLAQNTLKVVVKSDESKAPLAGASVLIPSLNKGLATDSNGVALFHNLPDGTVELQISFVGFTSLSKKISLPLGKEILEISLETVGEEDNAEVVVTSTRTDRSVRNTPTRVEVIGGGEIAENVSMRPGEIRMLLNESTGIITQQTSAVSNTANLRIQELDGRYTQVLRDGFPLYSGFSEGLSLVQIAPLDLKQVEIIKGSASTLYGGGAIAGLINLISKTPTNKREISFLANATSVKGLDISGFYSQRYGKAGLTLFTSGNMGSAYDPAGIGLTAIPKFQRYTFAPRLFLYGRKTTANIGIGFITEHRLGGSMNFVKHGEPGYFERNSSDRFTTQLSISHRLHNTSTINFKNSYSHFNRVIAIPHYRFEGCQEALFSELNWTGGIEKSQWVTGFNLYTDDFKERPQAMAPLRNYTHTTVGAFVQNTHTFSPAISLESGLRGDHTNHFGFIFLPRLSLLVRLSDKLSSRIGGGLGYKTPTIFTEESEQQQFKSILPIDPNRTAYERSNGGNIDFTYKTSFDELTITVNPLFFYTRIKSPLLLSADTANASHYFSNAAGYTDSKGLDFSARAVLHRFKFFTGYTYTVAQNHFNGIKMQYPLAPKHRLHFDLVYELEGKLRLAFESYYTGRQLLTDEKLGRSFWTLGGLVERTWKRFSLFLNGEDLNDARQTRWDTIYTGSINAPTFRDLYAPLEGITINGGLKIKW